MRGHGTHMWMCGAMAAFALILLLATGSALAFLPLLVCMGMMGAMMYFIMGSTRGRGEPK
jgi:hypothetical protein